jgi:hypothetical protein
MNKNISYSTNRVSPVNSQIRELQILEKDLQSSLTQNTHQMKQFALKSEDLSENIDNLSSQTEKIEVESMRRLKKQSDFLMEWKKHHLSVVETDFNKKKNKINDFFEKYHTMVDKENHNISAEFENKIRILINDFQEKRYQFHLQKRKKEAETEEMKVRIFGKLNSVYNSLEEVSRKRKQKQEKAVEMLNDLKNAFERRLIQSERDRDENEVVLAQMLDSIINKFD